MRELKVKMIVQQIIKHSENIKASDLQLRVEFI